MEKVIPTVVLNKIKASLKFGEVQRQTRLAEVVVANIIIEEPPHAVLRFYTKGGTFIGEVPALDILAENTRKHQS